MFKGFNELPDEYFIRHRFPTTVIKGNLWGCFFLMVFFGVLSHGFFFVNYSDIPVYGKAIDIVIFSMIGLYIIPCIVFESKRLFARFHKTIAALKAVAAAIIEILGLRFLLGFLIVTFIVNGYGENENVKYAILYIGAGIMLAGCVLLNIMFWRRMRRRTIEGQFRAKGSGFWGNGKFVRITLCILAVLSPAGYTIRRFFSSLKIFFDESDGIFNVIIGSIMTVAVSVWIAAFAYVFCIYIASIYCIGRFKNEKKVASASNKQPLQKR